MDRNLGAMDIYYHGDSHYGDLYYQFGRKDPFSGPKKIYILKEDGSYSFETWSTSTYTIQNTAADADCKNVPYSIKNPLTFIKGDYWTYNDIYNPKEYESKIRWQDPYVMDDTGKSMFDPCPAGWKVPKDGIWNFQYFIWGDPLPSGKNYYPNGSSGEKEGTIFFPITQNMDNTHGGYGGQGVGYYSTCSSSSVTNRLRLSFTSNSYYSSLQYPRAIGYPVRCIQE